MAKRGWVVYGVILLCIILFFVMLRQNKVEGFVDPAPTLTAVVSTFAGSGTAGFADGQGIAASFNITRSLTIDSDNNLYLADSGNRRIRKITPSGVVSTFAGSGENGFTDDTGTMAKFGFPAGITIDSSGNLYVADSGNNMIRKITPSGVVSTIAGTYSIVSTYVNGQGTTARFKTPMGITIDSFGNLYVADTMNHMIRKITPSGFVSNFAGGSTNNSTPTRSGYADGTGRAALFSAPIGITIDKSNNLYVCDTNNHMIRKITPSGVVSTFAGSTNFGDTDGTGTFAGFKFPMGITIDSSENLYVADTNNNMIRKITPSGVVTTIARTYPSFGRPIGIAIDKSNNLYLSQFDNNTIAKISMELKCPANYYYNKTTSTCTTLPDYSTVNTIGDGYTCNGGYYDNGTACVQNSVDCPPGKYLKNGRCSDCSATTYQPKPNFTGDSCINKPLSNVETSTATSVTCQTGHTLSSDGTECAVNPCGSGTYSQTGSYPCTNCPQNSSCSATGFSCRQGYTRSGLVCQPNPCEIGQYSITGSSPCTACQTGYSTALTGSTTSTNCKITLQISDILKILNYSPTNPSAQYYGLTPANLNITGPQTFTQGSDPNYESYIIPPSLVTAAAINSVNGTSYHYTNPQGRPVNNLGQLLVVIDTLPSYTQGSIDSLTEVVNCSGTTPNTCTITYNSPAGGTVTTNPCLVINSWYDFDKGYCVNKDGTKVTTLIPCINNALYNREVNSCIPIQPPYFKTPPPNTTGQPGNGDYNNCLTVNGGDCQPVYTIGDVKTSTNPCPSSTPVYNFSTRVCQSANQMQANPCCSMGATNASKTQGCLPFIKNTPTKNLPLCASKPSICCLNNTYSGNTTCIKNKYWTNITSYKPGACTTSGFVDMGEDTMQTKRFKWAQNRKLLNAP